MGPDVAHTHQRFRRAKSTPTEAAAPSPRGPLDAAIACATAAFPLGLLVGWLICA
ncbi:MAG: hypothetical protein MSC30_12340 [Gaiellaceae bacterium MAG52_C11]|nr:hypothetical protein [Candidatus Gaiellasilicea maunaloa]